MTLDKLTREYLKAREELILSHARAGHSLTETADRLDVSRQALWNLIWRNGIPWHEVANPKGAVSLAQPTSQDRERVE